MTPLTPEQLYLDLLKKTLSFSLWPEPPVPVAAFNYERPLWKRAIATFLTRVLAAADLEVGKRRRFSEQERQEGRIWPSYADTMIGLRRLDHLQHCVETVLRDGIEGDLIETGVWRGGACIFMRGVLAAYGAADRRVFVADSFEGLPLPDEKRFPADAGDVHHQQRFLAVSEAQVRRNFERYGLLDDQVVFLKGWFKDTLPAARIAKLSILRLDGDMYESTMDALSNLYPKLAPGGFCIIDDYSLAGCRQAVDEYRNRHRIDAELVPIDWTSCYWRKVRTAEDRAVAV